MCWSASASLAFGTAGVAVAAYTHKKGESKYFTIPLLYFSSMEFLQFFGYLYLDQCGFEGNSIVTYLSYIHIAFQPIFVNMFLFYNLEKIPRLAVRRAVYGVSLFFTALILLKLVPFEPSSLCTAGMSLCGPQLCTQSGNWHLAWSVPTYTDPIPGDPMIYYSAAAFLVPLTYGAWAGVLQTILIGPTLALILSSGNPLEWESIWCFYSVFLIFGVFATRAYKKRKGIPVYKRLVGR